VGKRTLSKDGPHPLEDFQWTINLNLVGTFNLNRLQAWHMSKNEPEDDERCVMINTASIAAFEGQIGQVAYSAAKAGIAGMMLTMARDLGSLGIRVMAIAPSLFSTGITQGIPDEFAEALTRDAAFPKRMGRPEEYARLAVAPSLFSTGITQGIPDEFAEALTRDAAFPKRMGRPEEYARLAVAIIENPMLNGSTIRLDAGQRFAPK